MSNFKENKGVMEIAATPSTVEFEALKQQLSTLADLVKSQGDTIRHLSQQVASSHQVPPPAPVHLATPATLNCRTAGGGNGQTVNQVAPTITTISGTTPPVSLDLTVHHIGKEKEHGGPYELYDVNESISSKPDVEESRIKDLENMLVMLQKMLVKLQQQIEDIDNLVIYGLNNSKIEMPTLAHFDGSGDPKTFLQSYKLAMKTMSCMNKAQIVSFFGYYMDGAANKWYWNLDQKVREDWMDMAGKFMEQYSYNSQLDVTLRDLETTKQRDDENVFDFIYRWRTKAAEMTNRPLESDQVWMVIRNMHSNLTSRLSFPFKTFEDLIECAVNVEEHENEQMKSNHYHRNNVGSKSYVTSSGVDFWGEFETREDKLVDFWDEFETREDKLVDFWGEFETR